MKIETHRNVKQRSTEMKHEPDTRQEPSRNRRRSTCAGHGRVRKWGVDWVPSMVVQPTSVAYSFLMECPIPSMKSEMRQRRMERNRDKREMNRKKRKRNTHLKEIRICHKMGNSNNARRC